MVNFNSMINELKGTEDYAEGARLLHYAGNVIEKEKGVKIDDVKAMKSFAVEEMKRLLKVIPETESHKKKDEIFNYQDSLLHVLTSAMKKVELTEDEVTTAKAVIALVEQQTVLERTVDRAMQGDKVDAEEINIVLNLVAPISEEYQRGKIFSLLLEYKDGLNKLTDKAKKLLSDYTETELKRMLALPEIDKDVEINLEFAVDVSKYYADESLLNTIPEALKLPYGNVLFYAVDTLLGAGKDVPDEAVTALANDLCYADLTYSVLCKYGKEGLFPPELTDPVYLAKSDMIHWLIYPTELNKVPDEIEYLGSVDVKKETYYIFKYKSDSDNLTEDLKNVWLIGWSGGAGTFSNFDPLSDYEKETTEKTLKNIKKKLL